MMENTLDASKRRLSQLKNVLEASLIIVKSLKFINLIP